MSAYTVEEGSLPHELLTIAAGAEIFKTTTKIDTSPNKAKALMTTHTAGNLTLEDIKEVAESIDTFPSGHVVVNISQRCRLKDHDMGKQPSDRNACVDNFAGTVF